MKAPIVFFDLETGGVKPEHPNIQLAAVAVRGWEELGSFERKIRFQESASDPEALRMNHYDPEVWARDAVEESEAVREFAAFLRPYACVTFTSKRTGNPYSVAQLAGHHAASFDGPRLREAFRRHDVFLPADPFRVLDTVQLALWHFRARAEQPESFKLGVLAAHFGIDAAGAHEALADVRLCAGVARALTEPA